MSLVGTALVSGEVPPRTASCGTHLVEKLFIAQKKLLFYLHRMNLSYRNYQI
jgi:hypothetical protein